jgi:hypothetical protein
LGIDGLETLLVNPFGPVQFQVAVPTVVVVADKFNVLPLQMGAMLPMTGVTGGVGSTSVNGPTALEGHPFKVTDTFVYAPAASPDISMFPLAFATSETVTGPVGPVY